MSEPQQGLSYDEILALARTAEQAGFETYFRSDHYASFPGEAGLPTTDAWATLAGLARELPRIGLGTLVSPVTFRLPGNLAKVVATVAEMSGGRVELGLGAGWNELEHRQLGLPFAATGQRFDMLEEQLAIVHGLWTEPAGWSYEGRHWQISVLRHQPGHAWAAGAADDQVRVAQYADEINISSAEPPKVAAAFERVRAACGRLDRDPDSVTYSAMVGVLVGRDEADLERRIGDLLAAFGREDDAGREWLAERRERWIFGTPDEARRRVDSYAAAGVERIMLQDFLPRDLEMVRLLGDIFGLRSAA